MATAPKYLLAITVLCLTSCSSFYHQDAPAPKAHAEAKSCEGFETALQQLESSVGLKSRK